MDIEDSKIRLIKEWLERIEHSGLPIATFFLNELCDCDYKHIPLMAPSSDILDDYKRKKIDWFEYVTRFNKLIKDRKVEDIVTPHELNGACLLCAEPSSEKCHRRLVAEYLRDKFDGIEIKHL